MDKSVQNYSKSAEYANKNRRITYVSLRPVAKVARGMQLFCMTGSKIRKKFAIIVNDLQVCRSFCTGLFSVVGVG